MGTICDACLFEMADAASRHSEWAEKDEDGCDCWECEWCEEHHPECRRCRENDRPSNEPYCGACFQQEYGQTYEEVNAIFGESR